MSKKEVKTNAMRMLDRMKIPYEYEEYECDEFSDGIETADKLGYDHKYVYKTLVTTGKSGGHYVFVIPIEKEIDFKKAAIDKGDWICAGRLYINRNEETVPDSDPGRCKRTGAYACQRWKAGHAIDFVA